MLGQEIEAEIVGFLIDASIRVIQADGVDARARLVAEILLDCDAVEPGILVALAVAYASEGFSDEERVVIERIADAAELPRARLNELTERVRARADGGDPVSVRSLLAAGRSSEA
jgi:hypothetical protein